MKTEAQREARSRRRAKKAKHIKVNAEKKAKSRAEWFAPNDRFFDALDEVKCHASSRLAGAGDRPPVTDQTTDPLQGADAGTRLPEAQSLAGAPLDGAEGDSKPSR